LNIIHSDEIQKPSTFRIKYIRGIMIAYQREHPLATIEKLVNKFDILYDKSESDLKIYYDVFK